MTLREKFIEAFKSGKRFDIKNAEILADEFAIDFAEWYFKKAEKYDSYLKLKKDSKELLEIYKKEKGL